MSSPTSAVEGRRPVATSSSSASTVRPPSTSTVTCASGAGRSTQTTSASVRTSMSSSANARATSSPANGSRFASRRGPRSITVTWDPRRENACAISVPTAPPPSTPSRPGIARADTAARLFHAAALSSPGTDGTSATLPVARTTARRASIVVVSRPSIDSISTQRAPASRPRPRWSVPPAPSTQLHLALVVPVADDLVAPGQRRRRRRSARRRLRARRALAAPRRAPRRVGSASCSGCTPSTSTRRRPARVRRPRPRGHRRRTVRRCSRPPTRRR